MEEKCLVDYHENECFDSKGFEPAELIYEKFKLNNGEVVDISKLRFNDPDNFVAGNVNSQVSDWKKNIGDEVNNTYLDWLENSLRVQYFIQPFKGSFREKNHRSDFPIIKAFLNAKQMQASY